jgi:hypothetical protein
MNPDEIPPEEEPNPSEEPQPATCNETIGFQPFDLEPQSTVGTVLEVTSSADSGTGSLRAAIDQLVSSDDPALVTTILIKLPANDNVIQLNSEIALKSAVRLDGSHSPAQVHISGQNITRHFFIWPRRHVEMRDLILENGWRAPGSSATDVAGAGGSIATGSEVNFKATNVIFRNNSCGSYGGGALRGAVDAIIHLTNVLFEGNSFQADSQQGGGAASFQSRSALYFTNVTFDNNHGINGGAFNSMGSYLDIKKSKFTNNSTQYASTYLGTTPRGSGGAIWAYTNVDFSPHGAEMIIEDTLFENNEGYGNGGAFYLFSNGGNSRLTGVHFLNNRVFQEQTSTGPGQGHGGGLSLRHGSYIVEDCSFIGNTAAQEGGGLWIEYRVTNTISLKRSYFKENTADICGGGLTTFSACAIEDVLLLNNQAPSGSSFCTNTNPVHKPHVTFSYTALIQQGVPYGPHTNSGFSTGDNVIMEPLPDLSGGDHFLIPTLSNTESSVITLESEINHCPYISRSLLLDGLLFQATP